MSRISGAAVWSNCPRTDLARAPAEKLAGATLLLESVMHKGFDLGANHKIFSQI